MGDEWKARTDGVLWNRAAIKTLKGLLDRGVPVWQSVGPS